MIWLLKLSDLIPAKPGHVKLYDACRFTLLHCCVVSRHPATYTCKKLTRILVAMQLELHQLRQPHITLLWP